MDRVVNEAGLFALVGSLVKQAVADYRDPAYVRRAGHGCPREALERWGLLRDGQLDPRFTQRPRTRTGRTSRAQVDITPCNDEV